ncbi:GM11815 [Drosophila sechellia]|uniref:GM11815 n=1 Tax=Drosophila sechellia TaxID=7238 RepID=B4IH45_DROSE|nr:GM11815 [Drosophila sechellia]
MVDQDQIDALTADLASAIRSSYLTRRSVFSLVKDINPIQRKWIFDSRCSYHRKPGGNQGQFFTYQQFLNYLESLQQSLSEHGS